MGWVNQSTLNAGRFSHNKSYICLFLDEICPQIRHRESRNSADFADWDDLRGTGFITGFAKEDRGWLCPRGRLVKTIYTKSVNYF